MCAFPEGLVDKYGAASLRDLQGFLGIDSREMDEILLASRGRLRIQNSENEEPRVWAADDVPQRETKSENQPSAAETATGMASAVAVPMEVETAAGVSTDATVASAAAGDPAATPADGDTVMGAAEATTSGSQQQAEVGDKLHITVYNPMDIDEDL